MVHPSSLELNIMVQNHERDIPWHPFSCNMVIVVQALVKTRRDVSVVDEAVGGGWPNRAEDKIATEDHDT